MEDPAQGAGPHVEGAHVARSRAATLVDAAPDQDQILEDRPGRVGDDAEHVVADVPAEPLVQVDASPVAEGIDRTPRARVDRMEVRAGAEEDPFVARILFARPEGDAAARRPEAHVRVGLEAPELFARRGVEGETGADSARSRRGRPSRRAD
jgi:hypothetical protein